MQLQGIIRFISFLLWLCFASFATAQPLLPMTNTWRFDQSGVDHGTSWKETNYNDSGWSQSTALFYTRNASAPAPLNTPLSQTNAAGQPIITYYFRTHFLFSGTTNGIFLVATGYVQAGAVFYLNGSEVERLRLRNGSITATTPGFVGPEAQANVLLFSPGALKSGDNVLAAEIHRQESDATTNSDILFGLSLTAANTAPPLPDLIIWPPSVTTHYEFRSFVSSDCEVIDGCTVPGQRLLLRFATETRNIGTADLVLGNPTNNPLFVYDPCHHHYHFEGYLDFRLIDTNGLLVATGKKIGFALVDSERWDTNANPVDHFEDGNQGIQHGWGDLYDYLLPCQYVDITGVSPGPYTLELEVDPDHKLPELDESNNITRVAVNIPPNAGICSSSPPNDLFSNAQLLPYAVASSVANSDCATREPNEPLIINNPGGRSVWFRWTAPYSGTVSVDTVGSDFDTILGLYSGASVDTLVTVAGDDDSGAGRTSRIVTNVSAGTMYSIDVDGYYIAAFGRAYSGNVQLNINANGNDFFAAAQPLTNVAGTILGTTTSATKESGEPNHAGNPGGHSLWYIWTAPFSGPVTFDTFGSRFNTLLAVYTGSIGVLTTVASNDDAAPNGTSRVVFQAAASTVYHIAIDGHDGAIGLCELNWRPSLRFGSPAIAGGGLQFNLFGLAGDRCLIEISSDLAAWSPWLHVTNSTGSLLITAPINGAQRFYRAHTE